MSFAIKLWHGNWKTHSNIYTWHPYDIFLDTYWILFIGTNI